MFHDIYLLLTPPFTKEMDDEKFYCSIQLPGVPREQVRVSTKLVDGVYSLVVLSAKEKKTWTTEIPYYLFNVTPTVVLEYGVLTAIWRLSQEIVLPVTTSQVD